MSLFGDISYTLHCIQSSHMFLIIFVDFLFNSTFNCSLLYCTLNLNQQLELLHTLLQRFCHERSMMERYREFLLFPWGPWISCQTSIYGNWQPWFDNWNSFPLPSKSSSYDPKCSISHANWLFLRFQMFGPVVWLFMSC